ncbi:alpha-L RNA-binding motif-containing protein [Yamadazyma tenuis ATCC 10573]|uniref:Small ribosomal subunit protein uS4m n=1 Tax=Candida tenuis (strain ATCC 10573 / BCRC 21748 / CBS 615 / JCM 9827 / NBRC 10315 / NRRL Y-1498 / VKM Y-70) TaxID=590646 RepID=G3BF42_CANTC|nr:alpha-L RNA-binding motif-containing protein [Yamadazyma tenuis ATCC 10573]EGV60630.1 alpha-L RNA-binding motif-containing protein [Yamadazyma tenuis ATCC 10573]
MPRRTQNMNSLSRGRVRSSMNKYNLFNLYKKPALTSRAKTLFQQKWTSKAETRAYHGEHLTESRWKTIFDPNLQSVAQLDASLKGLGVKPTPMALQTYAVLEKRLEFAVFRSMFASSIRQARQFILGGHVQVNGVTIKHPSFPLQSGDVFNVKPEKVLLAMGRVKPSLDQAIKTDNKQIVVWNKYVKAAKENPKEVWELKVSKPESLDPSNKIDIKASVKAHNKKLEQQMKFKQNQTTRPFVLSQILAKGNKQEVTDTAVFKSLYGEKNATKCLQAYKLLFDSKHPLVENFGAEQCESYVNKKSNEFDDAKEFKLVSSVKQILSELVKTHQEFLRVEANENKLPEDSTHIPYSPAFGSNLKFHDKLDVEKVKENEASAKVSLPWQSSLFGRIDPSKPYFTPWTPRPFIGCFAILPSHIEISFSTCHAIYLRDPVARPGHSEVISPFPSDIHERAYMFYARKGM